MFASGFSMQVSHKFTKLPLGRDNKWNQQAGLELEVTVSSRADSGEEVEGARKRKNATASPQHTPASRPHSQTLNLHRISFRVPNKHYELTWTPPLQQDSIKQPVNEPTRVSIFLGPPACKEQSPASTSNVKAWGSVAKEGTHEGSSTRKLTTPSRAEHPYETQPDKWVPTRTDKLHQTTSEKACDSDNRQKITTRLQGASKPPTVMSPPPGLQAPPPPPPQHPTQCTANELKRTVANEEKPLDTQHAPMACNTVYTSWFSGVGNLVLASASSI